MFAGTQAKEWLKYYPCCRPFKVHCPCSLIASIILPERLCVLACAVRVCELFCSFNDLRKPFIPKALMFLCVRDLLSRCFSGLFDCLHLPFSWESVSSTRYMCTIWGRNNGDFFSPCRSVGKHCWVQGKCWGKFRWNFNTSSKVAAALQLYWLLLYYGMDQLVRCMSNHFVRKLAGVISITVLAAVESTSMVSGAKGISYA